MDDDRLALELARRASSASPRPDWAQRDLLPAVRHEIDARPVRVAASRWSPLAGLATLVVAILVVAVAAPRLIPAPPTSTLSPSLPPTAAPGPVDVFSTEEFADRLATGQLDGKTVVVDGAIEGTFRRGPLCGPAIGDQLCHLGVMTHVNPPIEVNARWTETNEGEATTVTGMRWETWHFPSASQVGFLLLSVDGSGQVEFLGLARDFGPTLAWSVLDADAQHLDVNTVGIDEVILVRGWLVETEPPGMTIISDCFAPRPSVVPGLPYSYCQNRDTLSSEPPDDSLPSRGGPRISVQRNAAQVFGARMQDGNSLFAIAPRLYGGCSADEPTCWQWDVVARVDPILEPGPPPTPQIAEPVECPWLGWVDVESSPDPPPPDLPPPPGFVDNTGLVTECVSSDRPFDNFAMPVIDPVSDSGLRYHFNWTASPCDSISTLTLERVGDRYRLTIDQLRLTTLPGGVPPRECVAVSERQVRVELSQPIDPGLIDLAPQPDPGQTPAPSPTTAPSTTLECAIAPRIAITDHAGLITGCVGETNRGVPTGDLTISSDGAGSLLVTWPVTLDNCTPMDSVLELWRDPHEVGRYVLAVRMSNPNAVPFDPGVSICDAATGVHSAHLSLAQGVLPSDIDLFQTIESPGSAVGRTWTEEPAYFELFVNSNGGEISSEQVVDVSSSLVSNSDVTVRCFSGPLISVEQLDGPLSFQPGPFVDVCSGHRELHNGESLNNGFLPAAWALTDPNPLDPYVRDGKLYLPPGTYRFIARANFAVGEDFAEGGVQLEASVIVRVTSAPAPQPSPSPMPSTCATPPPGFVNCTGITRPARERIDQYWFGADILECMGMVPPESIEQQVAWSPVIVVGRPVSSRPWAGPGGQWEETWIDFEVTDVIKGSLPATDSIVVRVLSDGEPKGDLSDIEHLLLLWTEDGDRNFYLSGGYMSVYANVDGHVVTPEFAAIKQVYGRDHIFSTALDGMPFDELIARVKNAADSQGAIGGQGASFAC